MADQDSDKFSNLKSYFSDLYNNSKGALNKADDYLKSVEDQNNQEVAKRLQATGGLSEEAALAKAQQIHDLSSSAGQVSGSLSDVSQAAPGMFKGLAKIFKSPEAAAMDRARAGMSEGDYQLQKALARKLSKIYVDPVTLSDKSMQYPANNIIRPVK